MYMEVVQSHTLDFNLCFQWFITSAILSGGETSCDFWNIRSLTMSQLVHNFSFHCLSCGSPQWMSPFKDIQAQIVQTFIYKLCGNRFPSAVEHGYIISGSNPITPETQPGTSCRELCLCNHGLSSI